MPQHLKYLAGFFNIDEERVSRIASNVGSDVPFFSQRRNGDSFRKGRDLELSVMSLDIQSNFPSPGLRSRLLALRVHR